MQEHSVIFFGFAAREARDTLKLIRDNWQLAGALITIIVIGGRMLDTVDRNATTLGQVEERQRQVLTRLAVNDEQHVAILGQMRSIEKSLGRLEFADGVPPKLRKQKLAWDQP